MKALSSATSQPEKRSLQFEKKKKKKKPNLGANNKNVLLSEIGIYLPQ